MGAPSEDWDKPSYNIIKHTKNGPTQFVIKLDNGDKIVKNGPTQYIIKYNDGGKYVKNGPIQIIDKRIGCRNLYEEFTGLSEQQSVFNSNTQVNKRTHISPREPFKFEKPSQPQQLPDFEKILRYELDKRERKQPHFIIRFFRDVSTELLISIIVCIILMIFGLPY